MKFIMNQEQENALKFIVEQVKKYPKEIKIVSIGNPTNWISHKKFSPNNSFN